jgi:hypothetical protein
LHTIKKTLYQFEQILHYKKETLSIYTNCTLAHYKKMLFLHFLHHKKGTLSMQRKELENLQKKDIFFLYDMKHLTIRINILKKIC